MADATALTARDGALPARTAPGLLGTAPCRLASDLHHALSSGGPCSARVSTASLRGAVPSTEPEPAPAAVRATAGVHTAPAATGLLTVL
jgi:hypothetical protein